MNLNFQINPLDSNIEKFIKNNLDFSSPELYGKMNEFELDTLFKKTIKKFIISDSNNFSKEIILSIRSTLVKMKIISGHENLINNKNKIIQEYKNGSDIMKLSKKYNGSPLNILRLIFQQKYDRSLTELIKNKILLEVVDNKQLEKAIENDTYALINQNEILKKADEFENKIGLVLDFLKIKYKTQKDLIIEQMEKSNHVSNTPDFLILSDFYINGIKINWIDAKNFYGSDSKFIKSKILKQTKKYIKKWGYGAIIFNLSFNSHLKFDNILLIDWFSFEKLLI